MKPCLVLNEVPKHEDVSCAKTSHHEDVLGSGGRADMKGQLNNYSLIIGWNELVNT
jgi:hypothetical protein